MDILRQLFYKAISFTSFGVFAFGFTANLYVLQALEKWQFFYKKSRDKTSLKRHLKSKIGQILLNMYMRTLN